MSGKDDQTAPLHIPEDSILYVCYVQAWFIVVLLSYPLPFRLTML